jgi:hypothetical protein
MQHIFGGTFNFELHLTISRVADDKFVLSWLPMPSSTVPDLFRQYLDCFDFHIHGQTSTPSVSILGYDGNLSSTVSAIPSQMYVPLMELTIADVMKLLEHDGLICTITTHVYCMGDEVVVTTVDGFDPAERISQKAAWRWSQCVWMESYPDCTRPGATQELLQSVNEEDCTRPGTAQELRHSVPQEFSASESRALPKGGLALQSSKVNIATELKDSSTIQEGMMQKRIQTHNANLVQQATPMNHGNDHQRVHPSVWLSVGLSVGLLVCWRFYCSK